MMMLFSAMPVLVNAMLTLFGDSLVLLTACKVTQIGKVCFPIQMQPFPTISHRNGKNQPTFD
jgi:hypothetical protein